MLDRLVDVHAQRAAPFLGQLTEQARRPGQQREPAQQVGGQPEVGQGRAAGARPVQRQRAPEDLRVDPADRLEQAQVRAAVRRAREERRFVPGLGHPIHKVTDPRTPVLFRIAEQEGTFGPHLRLFEAIGRVHPQVLGRTLPLNGAGTCGAALADLGLPPDLLRGFALLARAAGLLGQLAEERRHPLGMDMYLTVDRNAVYVPPQS